MDTTCGACEGLRHSCPEHHDLHEANNAHNGPR
jgi:hypothetical protein